MTKQLKQSTNIGIVGLGLIGGSLGLELQSLGHEVRGLVHRHKTAERAKSRGLAQVISTDPQILSECDLVIIALPLESLLKPTAELISALPEAAVVTDVGSVKEPVLKVWQKLHPRFVASHPMAGTAESGVESGKIGLFRNRPWVVTPDITTDESALQLVHQLAITIGCKWVSTQAERHDQAVALISHLPVLISAALIKTLGDERDPNVRNLAIDLASSGFTDTTRVGGGNPQLGTSMAASNTSSVLKALTSYRWSLEKIEESIITGHWGKLETELERTQALRKSFFKKNTKN